MNKILKLILITIVCVSCNKDNCCEYIDRSISLSFVSETGEDLLDSNSSEYINHNTLRVYYLNKEDNNRLVSSPNAITPYYNDPENKNCIELLTSDYVDENNQSVTYLKFSESDMDTILCTMSSNSPAIVSKVRYNGKLIIANQVDDEFAVIIK